MSPRAGRSRSVSRRQSVWSRHFQAGNSISAATPEVTELIASSSVDTVGSTVLRVVGNISYAARTVDTDVLYHVGLIVGPNSLDAADIDPAVNTGLDWLWLEQRGWRQPAYDGVDSFENFWIELDLRGRRKFAEGASLWLAQNATAVAVTSFVSLSVLRLLP